jgi:hypothetical protein
MLICFTFFVIYAISVLTCTFTVFRLNPSMKNWIDKTGTLATSSLHELAALSDKEALRAFHRYLLFAAAIAFALATLLGEHARQVLLVCAVVFFYSAGSIGAWSNNRAAIIQKFLDETKRDSGRYTKYYLIFSLLLLLVVVSISTAVGEAAFANIGPPVVFVVLGLFLVIGSIVLANSISVAFVFAPAFLVIAYLWLAIFVARGVLLIGRNCLINALGAYCILGTIYLALLSLPGLRVWLGIPAICQ